MSGHKAQAKQTAVPLIVVGGSKRHTVKLSLRIKILAVLVLTIIVLGGVALLVVNVVHPAAISTPKSSRSVPTTSETQKPQTPQELAYSGQTSAAFAAYDKAITLATTPDAKADLYLSKATAALNAKQYTVAVAAALQLNTLRTSGASLALLAAAYEGQRNTKQAADYYQQAADYSTQHSSTSFSNAGSDQNAAKAKALSGGQ